MVAVEAVAVGLNTGYKVTKNQRKVRQNRRKGRITKRSKIVRELIREVAGFAPYERRTMELLRIRDELVRMFVRRESVTRFRRSLLIFVNIISDLKTSAGMLSFELILFQ
ncbi:50S ribosomal protein L36e [Loa loa]|uniref:60S ribosomal protein L36 n=1 Tax=Loa loa TaxID=7209 RepID=A0A1S0U2U8_LOALO|nr:50S ribosomal protein L36e [Loa loa]EFO24372.2 50S ribosomal protein L36e [Loa loa]